ncbi:hypothetical protein [Candidatus Enterococcus murrayae]|uniref:hypothetical protein n=1 Tax=Enterococcus TaxID=1350 RepID=UPI001F5C14A9|nr:hypothetical protein [Enterococcus sp. MJM16]
MIVELIITTIFMFLGIYSFVGMFSLIKVLVTINQYDELERRAVIEALAISMLIILVVNLAQLILSIYLPAEWRGFVSPGPVNRSLVTNTPLHMESFLFDCSIIGISYALRRHYFGLIKMRNMLIPIFIILSFILFPFLISLLF